MDINSTLFSIYKYLDVHNDDAKIVIRGVLDKIEDEKLTEGKATLIDTALNMLFGGTWNVITYPTCESEAGASSLYLHWHNKEWVYAEQTTDTHFDEKEVKKFMDTEFGWAKTKDINTIQHSVYTKINNRFPGTWRVHVAQLKNGYSSRIYGAVWKSDGFTFFIYRIA